MFSYFCLAVAALCTEKPLFGNIWKPGNVMEFGLVQRRGPNSGKNQRIFVVREI